MKTEENQRKKGNSQKFQVFLLVQLLHNICDDINRFLTYD